MTAVPSNRIQVVRNIQWTQAADQRLIRLRQEGKSFRFMAKAFGLGRTTITERVRRLGLDIPATPGPQPRAPQPRASQPEADDARAPLAAGHPISWGLITAGTCLEGSPYTPPEPVRRRGRTGEVRQ
jgi:hypothetical protein